MPEWITPVVVVSLIGLLVTAGGLLWRVSAWHTEVNSDRKTFHNFMAEIRSDTKKIFHVLAPPTSSQSPAQLTEYGERISRAIDGKTWAAKRAPDLVAEVGGMADYLVEDFCRKYVSGRLTADEKDMVLRAMYEVGSSREHISAVMTLVLSDALIEQRRAENP